MTADFLADLDVIGHLDWTPGCEVEGCYTPAKYLVQAHIRCCLHPMERLACKRHVDTWEEAARATPGLGRRCALCGAVCTVPTWFEQCVIDRIVPLGGSNG